MNKKNKIAIKVLNGKIDYINSLKGFSIITIVLFHLIINVPEGNIPSIIKTISRFGGTGVHCFIVCSGIGLRWSQIKNNTGFKDFIKKRFLKIYIPFAVLIIVICACDLMYNNNIDLLAIISNLSLMKMFSEKYNTIFGDHLWYISTITQLYLIYYPLIKIKKRIGNSKFCFLSLLISVFWWIIVYLTGNVETKVVSNFCFQYLWEFSLGICISDYLYKNEQITLNKVKLAFVSLICLVIGGSMPLISNSLKTFNDVPLSIGYISLAILICSCGLIKVITDKISIISYEIYLVHSYVISLSYPLIFNNNMYISLKIISIICDVLIILVISTVFHVVNTLIYNKKQKV